MMDTVGIHKVYVTLGASNHSSDERQNEDFYATDPIALDKLSQVFELPDKVCEVCAGNGHLSKKLAELGCNVISYDLMQREFPLDKIADFFNVDKIPEDYNILTNPPYKYAKEFVLHSLELLNENKYCIMLLRTTFLEGKGRYKDLFSKYPPKYIYVFSERINCVKNGQFNDYPSSAISYSWFIWQKGFNGEPIVRWL